MTFAPFDLKVVDALGLEVVAEFLHYGAELAAENSRGGSELTGVAFQRHEILHRSNVLVGRHDNPEGSRRGSRW